MCGENVFEKPECFIVNRLLRYRQHGTHPSRCSIRFCSVVVEALAGLLEVAVAFLCWGEPCLGQVLPVESAAAQLLTFSMGPGSLDGQ